MERLEGTWNRSIACGARPRDFLVSHLISGLLTISVQCIEHAIYVLFVVTGNLSLSSALILVALLILTSVAGAVFGLLVSVLSKTATVALLCTQVLTFPVTFISGEELGKLIF